MFSAIFKKGDNFCEFLLDNIAHLKWVCSYGGDISWFMENIKSA